MKCFVSARKLVLTPDTQSTSLTMRDEAAKVPPDDTVPCRTLARIELWIVSNELCVRIQMRSADLSLDVLSNILSSLAMVTNRKCRTYLLNVVLVHCLNCYPSY